MPNLPRQSTIIDSDYESCPVGGEWWTCEDSNYPTFIGCCSTDPCSGVLCSGNDLYPMGFGSVTTPVPDYPNHSCPYGGLWYTCADNTTPFQGCCESNPCNGVGCPAADLKPAGVHTIMLAGGSTFTVPSSVASGTSTSQLPTSTSIAAVPSSVATGTSTSQLPTSSSIATITGSPATATATSAMSLPSVAAQPNHTGAIAGGAAAGGIVFAVAVGLFLYFGWIKRRRQSSVPEVSNAQAYTEMQARGLISEHKGSYQDSPQTDGYPSPTPPYQGYYPGSASPRSPAPDYVASQQHAPQEIAGLGLSPTQYRQSMARQSGLLAAELENTEAAPRWRPISNVTCSSGSGMPSPGLRSDMS